ncbi:hypothetical protein M6B38_170290 [Iris pallida]|uniref:Uncharacterized protein n=1 Tax=Iris pallida TaxID=29817 RepID=A0AAX6ETE9_IRIPA|nr:hypothetical protein M6B38_224075 [Iris pallida]KAJ6807467.1 hypothetical protein M6B38_170290 [Iris pallida]
MMRRGHPLGLKHTAVPRTQMRKVPHDENQNLMATPTNLVMDGGSQVFKLAMMSGMVNPLSQLLQYHFIDVG